MADKLRKYKSLYSSTCNTFSTGEGVTITPASVTGLPTDTEITLTFDRVDSSGTKTPSKMERIRGTITGGNFVISSGGRAVEGTEQVHTSPVVEMIWNADDWNDTVDHILTEHNQDGTHKDTLSNKTETLTNKTLTSPVFQGTVDGWISANETWTYASASTITVPSGAAAKYEVGDKVKLTQTNKIKYFYIVGVTDTVLTLTGGSVYTVAEAEIVNPFYSHSESPIGFNKTFNFSTTITPQSGTYTSVRLLDNYFYINGIFLTWVIAFDGTLSGTPSYLDLTLPVPCVQTELIEPFIVNAVPGLARIGIAGTTNVRIEKIGGNWNTGAYSKGAGVLTYKIIDS